jgi:hypothetical protein
MQPNRCAGEIQMMRTMMSAMGKAQRQAQRMMSAMGKKAQKKAWGMMKGMRKARRKTGGTMNLNLCLEDAKMALFSLENFEMKKG